MTQCLAGTSLWMLLCAASTAANASTTYLFDYSGSWLGNSAEAHGSITLRDNFPNPADETLLFPDAEVTAFALTVSNASAGNGAFGLRDFDYFSWNTKGVELNLSQDLIGQVTVNGLLWASEAGAGGFGLGATTDSDAPISLQWYRLATHEGSGDQLVLTSFRPAPVPLPATIWLFTTAACSLIAASARRRCSPGIQAD